jgi:flavodoxin/ferredoxin
MKTLILYFSMSGYTRRVAEHIRDGIVKETGQCDLIDLANADTRSVAEYDLVGLGCPVYYYKEPFNVSDFIDSLPLLSGKHWFVFCTHGSVMGKTLVSMSERLQKRGVVVIGHFHVYADATAPFFPYPVPTSGHPDRREYEQAQAFGREITERSSRIAQGEVNLVPTPDPVPEQWAQLADMLTREALPQMFPPLHVDLEKCTFCHACEDSCPVGGIDVEADPPRIQSPCVYCYQCPMVCPTLAIDADWETIDTSFGENLFAMYLQELEKAEARGEFRRYVDPETIDLQDSQLMQRRRKLETCEE